MLSLVIEDGQITESYSMPNHDDDHHIGSAKRNTANGVAGIDNNGAVLGVGNKIILFRNLLDEISIKEGTSGEAILMLKREGVNDYTAKLRIGGSAVLLLNESQKNAASGIAGLDTNRTFTDELHKIVTVSINTTLTNAHFTVNVNATAGVRTITLPAAATNSGRIYHIKKIDSSGNGVTIDGNGAETIDGAATQTLAGQWDSYTIHCDGTGWYII